MPREDAAPNADLLAGRSAIVTGSSRGIGRAVAHALAAEGASVVVNGRTDDVVAGVVEEITNRGHEATGFAADLSDFEAAGALVDHAIESFGRLDILVNCAGIAEPDGSSILNIEPGAWRDLIDSHLTATFNTCRHAAPHMVERGSGVIINTSSHAYLGYYGGTGYAAGKGGVNSLSFALAAELAEHGVRVNAICPGARTRLSTGPAYEEKILDLHARGILNDLQRDSSLRPGEPQLVGPLYVYLASPLSEGIAGRIFTASAGYVGVHAAQGQEELLAFRGGDEPWPVRDLAEELRGKLHGG